MIALVLILVPVVTVSLMNQLPEDRIPTITIVMGPLENSSVSLYHKGGDWVRITDIRILVNGQTENSWKKKYQNMTYDLGDRILLTEIPAGATIGVAAKNAVIYTGVARS